MALPTTLKNFNVFGDGNSFAGQVSEVQLPKLGRKMEAWRGGGMIGEIDADMGLEGLLLEHTYGGLMRPILSQWGLQMHDGALIRFAGAYKAEDSEAVDSVEVVVRGRHKEIDLGQLLQADHQRRRRDRDRCCRRHREDQRRRPPGRHSQGHWPVTPAP